MKDPDITRLLQNIEGGDRAAFDRLLVAVYPALRNMARGKLRDQRAGHTHSPTGLVHEAYLRLVPYQDISWQGRAHFFGAASQTMRRILVDHARAKAADKRKGQYVTLSVAEEGQEDISLEKLLEIDDALARLEAERPRWARVIECRYFGGLTIEETAEALGVSHGTVSNDWQMARAWLKRELDS
jgi:RNA polymerase sigma factor (TIGR02999 family)